MLLDLLDDVFLLHFALKTAQRAFQSFTILQIYFCQLNIHLTSIQGMGIYIVARTGRPRTRSKTRRTKSCSSGVTSRAANNIAT